MLLPNGSARISLEKTLSLSLERSVLQMLDCSYKGPARRLFMQAKGLEILSRQLLEFSRRDFDNRAQIGRSEVEKLYHAREILEREFADPPDLLTLAHRVGLNDFKLKRGFRQVFGTTGCGYLRQYRLEQATQLLSSGRVNVDETAHTLGFHDTAHFIRQFKQHYGTTPGTFLKQIRSRVHSL